MRNRSTNGFLLIFEFFKGHDHKLLKRNAHEIFEISQNSANILDMDENSKNK